MFKIRLYSSSDFAAMAQDDPRGRTLLESEKREQVEAQLFDQEHPELAEASEILLMEDGKPVQWWRWYFLTGAKTEHWLQAPPGDLKELQENWS